MNGRRIDSDECGGSVSPPISRTNPEPPVQNITRTILGVLCLSVVAVTGVPTSSLACRIKTCSPASTATPFREVLNEDQFDDTEGQINSQPARKRGTFTDDVLMFIEGRRDMMGKNKHEHFQVNYGDWIADVKTRVDEWIEQNNTADNRHPDSRSPGSEGCSRYVSGRVLPCNSARPSPETSDSITNFRE